MAFEDRRRRRTRTAAFVAAVAAASTLAACGSSGPVAVSGGTISFAERPGAAPDYIFPFAKCADFSVSNLNQFQFLMYRPLYWFGLGSSTAVQYQLSPAKKPVFSHGDTVVTIHLKGWRFSDHQSVDAQSVLFFLNMYKADPSSYCGYNAGYGIPDELASASGTGKTLVLHFSRPVSPVWILYNYLSELTPMPEAWDKTTMAAAPGSGHCASGVYGAPSTDAACLAVERFLDAEAVEPRTYTGPLWQVVDGPWKLVSFTANGDAEFVPNKHFSGHPKPKVARVDLVAFASTGAEEAALKAGTLTIGYVDPGSLPGPAPGIGRVGPNVAAISSRYSLRTGPSWSFNYAAVNFSARDPESAELGQLYVRQALQETIDQVGIINRIDKGYGVPTCSPIPPYAPATISAPIGCEYPYDPAKAAALLTAHGWTMVRGVRTCTRPGIGASRCGPGIARGATLEVAVIYEAGSPALQATWRVEAAAWSSIGIKVALSHGPFDTVVSECDGGSFQICSWRAGWVYAPDYFPSGETLFTPGGSFNTGRYLDATMTTLITQSVTVTVRLTAYGQYAAAQLPVLYEPNPTETLEVSKRLLGVTAPNPLQNFMPELLSF